MRRLLPLLLLTSLPVQAVPVIPQFTQGTLNSHTETATKVTETITSIDFQTGWQYSVTGTNLQHSGSSITPTSTEVAPNTVNGITTTWVGLDHSQKPNWNLAVPGSAFQFTESYSGPGLSQITTIQRETEIESITDTVSVFQQ